MQKSRSEKVGQARQRDPLCPQVRTPSGLDESNLDALSLDARQKIRDAISNAHADVLDSGKENGSIFREASMKKVFDAFADAYFSAQLLTEEELTKLIPMLVYDAAVAGAWQTGAVERNSRFTLQFGHYWVPEHVPARLGALFKSQASRWRAKIVSNRVEPSQFAMSASESISSEHALHQRNANITPRGPADSGKRAVAPSPTLIGNRPVGEM